MDGMPPLLYSSRYTEKLLSTAMKQMANSPRIRYFFLSSATIFTFFSPCFRPLPCCLPSCG